MTLICFLIQNDKLKLLKAGSLQHLGENMLAFLLQVGASSHLSKDKSVEAAEKSSLDAAIYFDILVRSWGNTDFVLILSFGLFLFSFLAVGWWYLRF